jgi:hypothetical protein
LAACEVQRGPLGAGAGIEYVVLKRLRSFSMMVEPLGVLKTVRFDYPVVLVNRYQLLVVGQIAIKDAQ